MKKNPCLPPRGSHHAFSIVEALVVVAILGILTAIGLMYLGGEHHQTMNRVRDRRNAQEIASLVMGATAAGAPVLVQNDLESTIQNLLEGRDGTLGTFKGRVFRISPMTADEVQGAMRFLAWQQDMVVYSYGED